MKRFLVLIVVVLVGCEEPKPLSTGEIIKQVNASGKITDAQAESLSKVSELYISEALQPLIDKYKNQ